MPAYQRTTNGCFRRTPTVPQSDFPKASIPTTTNVWPMLISLELYRRTSQNGEYSAHFKSFSISTAKIDLCKVEDEVQNPDVMASSGVDIAY
ncbi:histidine kinase [Anopheles sinensis]|uniref:Histidine kinase n=1 Tax=Anopheles sinensis TaxID=74873 RepID=A0A084VG74_ANOSI|nr:histidine kinase [Anopheles sinensis]